MFMAASDGHSASIHASSAGPQRVVVRGLAVALVERGLEPPPPLGVDDGRGVGERRELAVAGVGDRDGDPGLGAVGEPEPVALVERVALELEVVEEHEDVGGRDQREEPLPGQERGLHQGHGRCAAVHGLSIGGQIGR